MTDKQIIIHGVNVNRCMFFNEEYEEDDIQMKNFCEWQYISCQEFDCAKCYFKNWKRKEQECEEFRKANDEKNELLAKLGCPTIATAKRKVFCLQEQLDQLKAEVKSKTEYIQEQREIIDQYTKEIEMYKKCQGKRASKREEELKAENENWQKEYWKLEQGNDFLAEKNSRLRGCLTEIKDIAEKIDDSNGCAYGDYDCDNCSSLEQETVCTYKVKKLILQKISECEVGNE